MIGGDDRGGQNQTGIPRGREGEHDCDEAQVAGKYGAEYGSIVIIVPDLNRGNNERIETGRKNYFS